MRRRALRNRDLWILGGVVVAGAVARFATLDLQSFHHDEAVMADRVIQPGLWDTFDQVVEGERSPPLDYLVSWAWSQPFGTGEIGLRSLSALIGTVMVPAGFLAGRELLSTRAGLYSAAFVAVNPLLVWYSQEARSYVLVALFLTLSIAFFARSLDRSDSRTLALWALSCALALCSHYFAIFFVVPQAAWLLLKDPRSRRRRLASGAIALTVLALAPLAVAQQGDERRNGFTDVSLPGRVAEVALDYSASEDPDPLARSARVDAVQIIGGAGGGVLILAAAALALTRGADTERRAWGLPAGIALVGVGVPVLAAAVGFDFLKPRNAMAGAVPVLLATASGFAVAGARRLGLGLAGALCLLYVGVVVAVNSSAEMQREDWRHVADVIGESSEARLLAVPQNGDDPLLYYLGAERFVGRPAEAGAEVDEVVAVSTASDIDLPRGFQVVEETPVPPLFTVWTLRANTPRVVRGDDLATVLVDRSTTLHDPPSR